MLYFWRAMRLAFALRFIALLLLLPAFALRGQDSPQEWQFAVSPFAGFILPHHPEMRYLQDERLWGLELSASRSTDGSKDWHHWFNFPQWGLMLDLYDFGSPYLGRGISGKVYFDLPVDRQRRFGLKLSIGAGYVEKIFDVEDNFHNSAIGSHLNATLGVEGHVRLNLGDHLLIKPGIGLYHFSNGAFRMPNSGVNMPGLRLGVAYRPEAHAEPQRRDPGFDGLRSAVYIGGSGGAKEIKPIGGPKYAVINLFALWTLRVSPKSSFGAEGGLNYNASLRHRLADIHLPPGEKAYNYRPFVAAIYQIHFDPLTIRFGLGHYIDPKFERDGNIFMRYHLAYQWGNWQFFGGLKSHYARADNVEVGIAHRIYSGKQKTP